MNTDSSARERRIRKAMEESLPALRAFARGLCLDRMTADDLVQATCARALGRFEQVVSPEGVRSWLYRILYTQWQDTLRSRRRERNTLFQFGLHLANGEEQRQTATESRQLARLDVERALAGLVEEQRAAVVLVDMLGYGYQEAAQVLGLPVGTVASRVARARGQLASALAGAGVLRQSEPYHERSVYETSG
jgi:RNA polymerase sigma-70 factor (ECF subfamily)